MVSISLLHKILNACQNFVHRIVADTFLIVGEKIHQFLSGIKKDAHTHTRLTALFLGLPGWAGTRKVKPIGILLKQETVSGSGISWAICKSAPRSKQMTMPSPHHSVFYRLDALPAAQPTVSKHWRHPEGCTEKKIGSLFSASRCICTADT